MKSMIPPQAAAAAFWRVERGLSSARAVNRVAVSEILTFPRACVTRPSGATWVRTSARMAKRNKQGSDAPPWKLLLWTAIAGILFGVLGMADIGEDWLRVARNGFHEHRASGQVVVIKIDDQALRDYGNWPWPRHEQAQLVDRLSAARANRIFYDINFSFASNPADDRAFADAIARSGR